MLTDVEDIEKKLEKISYSEKIKVLKFLADNISNEKFDKKDEPINRKLGGYEKGFWIADDFDETPECMRAYV